MQNLLTKRPKKAWKINFDASRSKIWSKYLFFFQFEAFVMKMKCLSKNRGAKFKRTLRLQFSINFIIFFLYVLSQSSEMSWGWLTHQKKSICFYFGTRKNIGPNLKFFMANRQSKFKDSIFWVCNTAHTHDSETWNLVCLFAIKILHLDKYFFLCQSELPHFV